MEFGNFEYRVRFVDRFRSEKGKKIADGVVAQLGNAPVLKLQKGYGKGVIGKSILLRRSQGTRKISGVMFLHPKQPLRSELNARSIEHGSMPCR